MGETGGEFLDRKRGEMSEPTTDELTERLRADAASWLSMPPTPRRWKPTRYYVEVTARNLTEAADRIDALEAMHDPEHWVSDTDHGAICNEFKDTIARLEAETEQLREVLRLAYTALERAQPDTYDHTWYVDTVMPTVRAAIQGSTDE